MSYDYQFETDNDYFENEIDNLYFYLDEDLRNQILEILEIKNISRNHPKHDDYVVLLISIKVFEETAIKNGFSLDKYWFYDI